MSLRLSAEAKLFFPKTMMDRPNWVLWRLEWDEKTGRTKKVPYSPIYGGKASTTNNRTWASYKHTRSYFMGHRGEFRGVGFVFDKDSGLTFIDLDHCLDEDGQLASGGVAENIVSQFADSYCEMSQSGTGLHIICRGEVPTAVKTQQVELYDSGRFVALTGRAIYANEPTEHQADLTRLYNWLQAQRLPKTLEDHLWTPTPDIRPMDIEALVEKAKCSKGGDTFVALLEGNWQGLGIGDGSQSSADLSFANRLAFWCGGNKDAMQAVFRQSGLYRNDRKMNLAIKTALKSCGTIYRGRQA